MRQNDTFVSPFYHGPSGTNEGNASVPLVSGVLSNATASVSVAPGTDNTWTVRFRRNGGPDVVGGAEITCTISGTARSCTAAGSLTFDHGDLLSVMFDEGDDDDAALTRMAFSADFTETNP